MNKLTINAEHTKSKINKNIYGHFSEHLGRCIYGGLYVGENSKIPNVNGMRSDVVKALKNIKVPVLRWPGGCFADTYHWKGGIGPKENRTKIINTTWGGIAEDNSFGTHEFMELCRQLGCEPYVSGNLGSGTVQEMSEWVEYMSSDNVSPMADLRRANGQEKAWGIKYFGIGNESWGGGGNMSPEFYSDLFRQYQTYVNSYGKDRLVKIASGPNGGDYHWTEKVMELAGHYMDGIALHYYTVPGTWEHKNKATGFNQDDYYETLNKAIEIEKLISNHLQVMNRYDPEHHVGLVVDEWGTWFESEPDTILYQQNTMRDAMVAAVSLNIFNQHSDRIMMANLAQIVNVLQAVILTKDEKMILTPTYHVFDLYKNHQDATLLDSWLQTETIGSKDYKVPEISQSVSMVDNKMTITLANLSATESAPVECVVLGGKAQNTSARILLGTMEAKNDFDSPETVGIKPFAGISVKDDKIMLTAPACSVIEITADMV